MTDSDLIAGDRRVLVRPRHGREVVRSGPQSRPRSGRAPGRAARKGGGGRNWMIGAIARKAASRSWYCWTRRRATSFATIRAPTPRTRWRAPSRSTRSIAATTQELTHSQRGMLYLPLLHSESLADKERAVELTRPLTENPTFPQVGGSPPRNRRPFRPVPAPQRNPGPRDNARGSGLPRRARLGRLSISTAAGAVFI